MTPVEHLVAALRIDAAPADWLAALSAAKVDQDELAITALALGLAPLLHRRLETWGETLPAEKVYPAPGLRPMNDIDLLFRPEDLPAVAGALHALGYGSKE